LLSVRTESQALGIRPDRKVRREDVQRVFRKGTAARGPVIHDPSTVAPSILKFRIHLD